MRNFFYLRLRATLFLCALSFLSFKNEKKETKFSFLEAKAKQGDDATKLLSRYRLDEYACNLTAFLKQNKLKKNVALQAGKAYTLPLRRYTYNGKNIRSSISSQNWELAKNIHHYNHQLVSSKILEKKYEQSKVLLVPNHLLEGCEKSPPKKNEAETDLANAKAGKRIYPIFGKKFQHVPLKSNRLKGQVFFISPGHGGPDSGAIAKQGKRLLCEDEYAYDVALRLTRLLLEQGATPYLITRDPNDGLRDEPYLKCDTDEVCWGGEAILRGQKARLNQRCSMINTIYEQHRKAGAKKQRLVGIHVDSRAKSASADVFFYHRPSIEAGKKLAENVQKVFKAKYKSYQGRTYHGTVTGRDLHLLRETKPIGVYIELGNIKNPNDQQRILLAKNRQYLAEWLFEGLTK